MPPVRKTIVSSQYRATRDFGHSGYRSIPAMQILRHLSAAPRLGCIVKMIFCFRFDGISKFPFIHGSSAAPRGVPVRGLGQRRGRVRAAVAQRPSGRHVQCRYRDGLLSRRFLFRLSVRRGQGFHGLADTGPKPHRPITPETVAMQLVDGGGNIFSLGPQIDRPCFGNT